MTAGDQHINSAGRRGGKVFGQLKPEVIIAGSHDQITLVILALRGCPHHGAHHFAVIGEGRQIACANTAAQCLRDQGIEIEDLR